MSMICLLILQLILFMLSLLDMTGQPLITAKELKYLQMNKMENLHLQNEQNTEFAWQHF